MSCRRRGWSCRRRSCAREARRRGILTVVDGATRPAFDRRSTCRDDRRPTSTAATVTSGCWRRPAPASCTSARATRTASAAAGQLGLPADSPARRRPLDEPRRVRLDAAPAPPGVRGHARHLPLAGRARRPSTSRRGIGVDRPFAHGSRTLVHTRESGSAAGTETRDASTPGNARLADGVRLPFTGPDEGDAACARRSGNTGSKSRSSNGRIG